jgi:hypothetical protein
LPCSKNARVDHLKVIRPRHKAIRRLRQVIRLNLHQAGHTAVAAHHTEGEADLTEGEALHKTNHGRARIVRQDSTLSWESSFDGGRRAPQKQ